MNTRFAPSPTGYLHLGGLRTALFNWLGAKATGGKFILRIDDTDLERSKTEYEDDIKKGLEWLGLEWDEEYKQSERNSDYLAIAEDLLLNNLAKIRDDHSICLCFGPLTHHRPTQWTDSIKGNMKINDDDWEHVRRAIIIRSNSMPLYNFASTCDDLLLNVDWIIRGVDHIPNTPLQETLIQIINPMKTFKYTHIGLIHGTDNKKMSKRSENDDFLVRKYIEEGYHPDAMFNALLRLGWGPKTSEGDKALTRERAIELFLEHGNLRSAPSKFDPDKLNFWNRKFKSQK